MAAFHLFNGISDMPGVDAWFLGCQRNGTDERLGSAILQPFTPREFVYCCGEFDWFSFANRDAQFPNEFEALLTELQPDVLHFHHYINFGVEAFLIAKRILPDVKIVLTLHEYLAICHHFGQMITKGERNLCYESSPTRCNKCFPEIGPSDFFLRRSYIERFFDLVDHFLAPSEFLAARYREWGIPHQKISVIENLIVAAPATSGVGRVLEDHEPLRVGFFGQLSFLKGLDVILRAAQSFEADKYGDVVFEIFGDYRGQPPEFQKEFLTALAKSGANLRYHGPYDQRRVDQLMQTVDAVLVPSIWWENSPLVIQEALRNRKPIICSDIGGMAEKVRDGKDGFHFPVGNPAMLATLLKRLAGNRKMLADIAGSIASPPAPQSIIDKHTRLYRQLRQVGLMEEERG